MSILGVDLGAGSADPLSPHYADHRPPLLLLSPVEVELLVYPSDEADAAAIFSESSSACRSFSACSSASIKSLSQHSEHMASFQRVTAGTGNSFQTSAIGVSGVSSLGTDSNSDQGFSFSNFKVLKGCARVETYPTYPFLRWARSRS